MTDSYAHGVVHWRPLPDEGLALCGLWLTTDQLLDWTVSDKMDVTCSYCVRILTTDGELFECAECGRRFVNGLDAEAHEMSHN